MRHGLRLLGAILTVALLGGAAALQAKPTGSAGAVGVSAHDYYYNLSAPLVDTESGDAKVKPNGTGGGGGGASSDLKKWWGGESRKHSQGFPRAATQLAKIEAKALKTGENPRQLKQAKTTQHAKLLTVLAEFNPSANDDFSGFRRLRDINGTAGVDCVTEPAGTTFSGPTHNNLGNPAAFGTDGTPNTIDNNSFWVPNFNADHYNKMMFTTTGITDRVRPDLTGPDGNPGFDISGLTMKNMYREMSKGAYDLSGQVAGWVTLPHSEAYYAADPCDSGRASDQGHPSNPRGAAQMIVDAVDAVAASQPNFPWSDYDVEDQGDLDGDGNVNEPDGVIDHFVIVHAGAGEEGGGQAQGTYAVWSHASVVDPATGGYTIPGASVKVFNYIAQPENAGVGVFAHEFGHDLGLPDEYDTSGTGDSDVEFWGLMSTGSHSGPIFQSMPANMGAWDKFVLGWSDPLILPPGKDPRDVQLGQANLTPVGTKDAIRVSLPAKHVALADPHSGAKMWWSNNDQSWADVRLGRTVNVPAGPNVRFWAWDNYVAEEDWDFGFIEVSTDNGSSWSQLKIRDEAGNLVSTDDDYTDPHGRLHDYGDLKYGLTGSSGGWRHDYVDLTPYAGQTIQLRLRYATDAGFEERGWFADDFSITNNGTAVFTDDVENGLNGWTAQTGSFAGTVGGGWNQSSGSFTFNHYYLAEWRNLVGFDKGLQYTYDSDYLRLDTGEWSVKRVPYNAPGLLVWYRNIQYSVNHVTVPEAAPPSNGSKGMLLLVDSHFDPLRRSGEAAAKDPSTLDNIQSRPQASNVAFTAHPTYPFDECLESPDRSYALYCTAFGAQPGVDTFTDKKGWYPGFEFRPGVGLFRRDIDASVVVPSLNNQVYTTRIVDKNGNPFTALYGIDVFGNGSLTGTGNPDQGPDPAHPTDVSQGVVFKISRVAKDNSYATISVTPHP